MLRSAIAALAAAAVFAPPAAAGNAWRPASNGLPPRSFVLSLAIEPGTSTVYAGMIWRGIHKSANGGVSWTSLSTNFPLLGEGVTRLPPDIPVLAADPRRPGTLYAGTSFSGVLKTLDGGSSWSLRNEGLDSVHPATFNSPPLFRTVAALVLDPRRPETLYAGMPGVGIVTTADGGASWHLLAGDLAGLDLKTLVLDPASPLTLYAGTLGRGVFKSVDGGRRWRGMNRGLGSKVVEVLALDPARPGTVYAGTLGGGVFKSVDGGRRWRATNLGLGNRHVAALVVDVQADVVYAGTLGGGVFRSVDGGTRWEGINRGLTNRLVHALVLDPTRPGVLYAGTLGAGVFALEDESRR